MRKKVSLILYMFLIFGICLIPSVGLLIPGTQGQAEREGMAEFPGLVTQDGIQISWLSQLGSWLEEHFAFRSELVTANAMLESAAFGVSADDGVIEGTDGWLYYSNSLDNFLGRNQLFDREIFNIAHSLSLMQEYAAERGADFLFVPVPNKNTLYGDFMPYYASYRITESSNLKRLYSYLEKEGVAFLDLYGMFSDEEEILYHKTDSHWTNRGAAMAATAINREFRHDAKDWSSCSYTVQNDFVGDLQKMLFPANPEPEAELYYEDAFQYEYQGNVNSNFDPKIQTVQQRAEGSIVVYRDSFGNALLPFLADTWQQAYFSRVEEFPLADLAAYGADAMVIERAERFLPNLAKNAAVMEAPSGSGAEIRRSIGGQLKAAGSVSLQEAVRQGELYRIEGALTSEERESGAAEAEIDTAETAVGAEARIFVSLDDETFYEAFPITIEQDGVRNPWGFRIYLPAEAVEAQAAGGGDVRLYIGCNDSDFFF